jgi:hypothetical protein
MPRIILVLTLCLFGAQIYAAPTLDELQAEITSLKATVTTLQNQLSSDITKGNVTLTSVQNQVTLIASNPALALGPFVKVDPNPETGVKGPNIVFSGANIHIVSGSGATNDNGTSFGLGNLIIGYDENPGQVEEPLLPSDRVGSHNLIIGRWHRFVSFGGIVAGEDNTITAEGSSVLGGSGNFANGVQSVVIAGLKNDAAGVESAIIGGTATHAFGASSTILGGARAIATASNEIEPTQLGVPAP